MIADHLILEEFDEKCLRSLAFDCRSTGWLVWDIVAISSKNPCNYFTKGFFQEKLLRSRRLNVLKMITMQKKKKFFLCFCHS